MVYETYKTIDFCVQPIQGVFNYYHTIKTFTRGSKAEASQPRSGGGEGAAARTRTQAEQKTAKPSSFT
jgi:hypothetical protein